MDKLTWLDEKKTTVKQIDAFAKENKIGFPSGLKKAEKIAFIKGLSNSSESLIGYMDCNITLTPKWCGEPNWKEHLKEHGWCTVPISGWQESFVDDFFDWLEKCSDKFKRDDCTTWKTSNMIPLIHGIIKHGMSQTELQWTVRELCYPIFTELLGTKDLLCSFDGGCFLNTKVKKRRNNNLEFNLKDLWIHVDTSRCEKEESESQFTGFVLDIPASLECYQGIVNFVDNGELDGGLVLVERSQDFFLDYMADYPTTGFRWERAHTVSKHFDNAEYIKICAPAGHLILWDGRMFHCNVPPTISDPSKYRMCLYVSMQPKVFATEQELKKRQKLYEEGRMSGHWCYGPYFAANPKQPRTYGKEVVLPPSPEIAELNKLRSKLIGY